MPEESPQTAGRRATALDRAGFCDEIFEAYYGGGPATSGASGSEPPTRSRNTYMRTRARRLAAAAARER